MFKQYSAILALTATNGLLQFGHGALGSLMIQQSGRLDFSDSASGLLVSATYVGFLASNVMLRRLLPRVSFIRAFAVCAAIVSALTLLMPILSSEYAWIALRIFYGVFFCACVVVMDGWLNSNASPENRSKLLGVFMTAGYLSYGAGQYVLIIGESQPVHAFIVSGMMLALCMVPMCLTRLPEPQAPPREESSMRWRDAYAIAPVAFLGQFAFGMFTGATFLFIRYLEHLGISPAAQSTLAAMFFGFGFAMQIPVGWFSDRARDRRDVIIIVSGISGVCAVMLGLGDFLPYILLAIFIVLLGALSSTIFSLNIAYGQDFVANDKSAVYAGMLMRVYAVGGLLGPALTGFLMDAISPNMLFWFCALMMGGITLMTATNRLMPRYRPAKTEQFRPMSPLSAPAETVVEDMVYSETDIGPELPEEAPVESPASAEIGPEVPEDTPTEAVSPVEFGPEPPHSDLADESQNATIRKMEGDKS